MNIFHRFRTNEITAIPKRLERLELKGGIVTLDAMGCQTKIAAQIVAQGGAYFINSIPADAKRFAHAVRGHWGIENRLHWRLDVVFDEDASRIRKGSAPAILAAIRHLCTNLFEQEPSKLRLAQKRRKAAWNDDDRAEVVFG